MARGLLKAVTILADGGVEIEGFVRQSGPVPDVVDPGNPDSQNPREAWGNDSYPGNVPTMRMVWTKTRISWGSSTGA